MKIINFIIVIIVIIIISSSSVSASASLDQINQTVCNRFEEDASRLAAIMEELRNRKGITETRVAFGGSDTPIKSADYWVNFAAEAIAYQRVQKYSSKSPLRSSLEVLKNKVLQAKNAVEKVL